MFVKKLKKLPKEISHFLHVAADVAGRLGSHIYLVGGIVRDLILERESMDYDIAVEGSGIEFAHQAAQRLGVRYRKHHGFGTATIYFEEYKIDVATCRREYYPHWGALPRVSPASLKEDLYRRDFTINAMAVDLSGGRYGSLIDYYDGYKDLRAGVIRVLHDNSFLDDPTRILRAIRFAARFSFSMESHTRRLFKEAHSKTALKFIDEQRLRDELVLILKERRPLRFIKRVNSLIGFAFLDDTFRIRKDDYRLCARIEKAIALYNKEFPHHRALEEWLLYMMALLNALPVSRRARVCRDYCFRKGDQKRIQALDKSIQAARALRKLRLKKSTVYKTLEGMSFEMLMFLYAYYKEPRIRKSIIFFLTELIDIRTRVRGRDLKDLRLSPEVLYSKALRKLTYAKIEKGLHSKEEELDEICRIFARLRKRHRGRPS